VHVADHALAGRDRRRHLVAQRVPRLAAGDRRVAAGRGAAVAKRAVRAAFLDVAVVAIDDMAAGAARIAVVARVVVSSEKPHRRVVEAGLGDIEHRDRHPQPRRRPAVRLPQIGPSRLVELLDFAGRVGVADLREDRVDDPSAALEHAEDVARRDGLPRRQRDEFCSQPMSPGHLRGRRLRRLQLGRFSVGCVGLADDAALERQDAVVVGARCPEHRGGRHQAAF